MRQDKKFDIRSAEVLLTPRVRDGVVDFMREQLAANDTAGVVAAQVRGLLSKPFGNLVRVISAQMNPYDSVLGYDAESKNGATFIKGALSMYGGLKAVDTQLTDNLDTYVRAYYPGGNPGFARTFEDGRAAADGTYEASGQISREGGLGTVALGPDICAVLEDLEGQVEPDIRAQSFFRIGAGWTIHEMVLADVYALDTAAANGAVEVDWGNLDFAETFGS